MRMEEGRRGEHYLDFEPSSGGSLLLQLPSVLREQVDDELIGAALHGLNEIEEEGVLVLVAESFSFVVHLLLLHYYLPSAYSPFSLTPASLYIHHQHSA